MMGLNAPAVRQPARVRDCDECPELVIVEPGYVRLGASTSDPDASEFERPTRVVRLGRLYAIGRYEVTVGQYQAYLDAASKPMPACPARREIGDRQLPIECVSWNDAQGFLAWLNDKTRLSFRLPSEAEWEYAARAGSDARYATGRELAKDVANIGRPEDSDRAIDAGSCNGCELEIHALNNPIYNLEGLGIRFVASPRHADLLLVTGPVSRHMEIALTRTYAATPDPKLVVALGDCGCTGGIFGEGYASCGRVSNVIPVDVAIPGCPPSPTRILAGILTAISASRTGEAAELPKPP